MKAAISVGIALVLVVVGATASSYNFGFRYGGNCERQLWGTEEVSFSGNHASPPFDFQFRSSGNVYIWEVTGATWQFIPDSLYIFDVYNIFTKQNSTVTLSLAGDATGIGEGCYMVNTTTNPGFGMFYGTGALSTGSINITSALRLP